MEVETESKTEDKAVEKAEDKVADKTEDKTDGKAEVSVSFELFISERCSTGTDNLILLHHPSSEYSALLITRSALYLTSSLFCAIT